MSVNAFLRILLLLTGLWLSWLLMMAVHELGHVIAALATGGRVLSVVWHPLELSRTDVDPNPHPLIEVAAGPIVGTLLPLVLASLLSLIRLRSTYLAWAFAGFCLIANGVYLATADIQPVGDARQLLHLGVPAWLMATLGGAATVLGFFIWHRISPRFGFGRSPQPINAEHAFGCLIAAVFVTMICLLFGQRGVRADAIHIASFNGFHVTEPFTVFAEHEQELQAYADRWQAGQVERSSNGEYAIPQFVINAGGRYARKEGDCLVISFSFMPSDAVPELWFSPAGMDPLPAELSKRNENPYCIMAKLSRNWAACEWDR